MKNVFSMLLWKSDHSFLTDGFTLDIQIKII